jgi:organic radical activating enzyme
MRKIAFGYSTRCNVKCEHCVAADAVTDSAKMELEQARTIITDMATAHVKGISFTAGEPLLYLEDICKLLSLCTQKGIYSRVVTNSFWAKTPEDADRTVGMLKENGLCQLRLSSSRWHQKNITFQNVVNAAQSCKKNGLDYFVSFVTDFTEEDDVFEQCLRENELLFFPEPVIYSGRAHGFPRKPLQTDYQDNCCAMNPYLAPNLDMYACCDAGSHFTKTDIFHLGNLQGSSIEELFVKSEKNILYAYIRTIGISGIASFAGFTAREIVQYRKCELCEKLFNSPDILAMLKKEAEAGLKHWHR